MLSFREIFLIYFNYNNIVLYPFLLKNKIEYNIENNLCLIDNILYNNNFFLNVINYLKKIKRNYNLTTYYVYKELKNIEKLYNEYFFLLLKLTIKYILTKDEYKFLFNNNFLFKYQLLDFYIELLLKERENILTIKNIKIYNNNPFLSSNYNNYLTTKFTIYTPVLLTEEIHQMLKNNNFNLISEYIINKKSNINEIGNLSKVKFKHILYLFQNTKIKKHEIEKILNYEIKLTLYILKLKQKEEVYNFINEKKELIFHNSIRNFFK